MKYLHINLGPNRALRRKVNAVARREPTPDNLKQNAQLQKMPRNKPYRKPKEAA